MAVVVDVMKTVGTHFVGAHIAVNMGNLHQYHRQKYCQKDARRRLPKLSHTVFYRLSIARSGYLFDSASSLNFIFEQNSW